LIGNTPRFSGVRHGVVIGVDVDVLEGHGEIGPAADAVAVVILEHDAADAGEEPAGSRGS